MTKVKNIVWLVLPIVLSICIIKSSYAEKLRLDQQGITTLLSSPKLPQTTFLSFHHRRPDQHAINIGWGKRGKKIIQMRLTPGICREDLFYFPVLTVNNPLPKSPNYTLLRFSCFSHRGPPAGIVLS